MKNKPQGQGISFEVDKTNLYREEGYTDLQSATIRKLTPIKMDGSDDPERKILYIGHADLISPQGPIPIQADLQADSLEDAVKALPSAMEKAAHEVREQYNQMMERQKAQQEAQQSKIIKSTDQL